MNFLLIKSFNPKARYWDYNWTSLKNLFKKDEISFLDIGFGSGCIFFQYLKREKDFKATGIDIQ